MIEFDCEGCGAHVYATGRVPKHQLCATCAWLCEFIPDPDQFWQLYARLRQPDRPIRSTKGGLSAGKN